MLIGGVKFHFKETYSLALSCTHVSVGKHATGQTLYPEIIQRKWFSEYVNILGICWQGPGMNNKSHWILSGRFGVNAEIMGVDIGKRWAATPN